MTTAPSNARPSGPTVFSQLPRPPLDDRPVQKRIGVVLLATDHTTERDIARICSGLPIGVYANRIDYANPTTPENLARMQPRLRDGVAGILPDETLDAVYYSCTSASVTIGDDTVAAAIQEAKPGVPVVTPPLAARAAFDALHARRISILTPYLRETSEPMAAYFSGHGFEVLNLDYFGLADDREMARITLDAVIEAACASLHPEAEALFVSCTALRAAEVVERIEARTGRPVITSNQAGIWMTLRLAGIADRLRGHGRVFDCDPAPGTA